MGNAATKKGDPAENGKQKTYNIFIHTFYLFIYYHHLMYIMSVSAIFIHTSFFFSSVAKKYLMRHDEIYFFMFCSLHQKKTIIGKNASLMHHAFTYFYLKLNNFFFLNPESSSCIRVLYVCMSHYIFTNFLFLACYIVVDILNQL
jgi:hypothetical protein